MDSTYSIVMIFSVDNPEFSKYSNKLVLKNKLSIIKSNGTGFSKVYLKRQIYLTKSKSKVTLKEKKKRIKYQSLKDDL